MAMSNKNGQNPALNTGLLAVVLSQKAPLKSAVMVPAGH